MGALLRKTSPHPATSRHASANIALVVGALLLGFSACSVSVPAVGVTQGSGAVKTETRSVSGYSAVNLSGVGTLDIRQTGTESLTVTSDDNILPLLTSSVSGNTLRLGLKLGSNPRPTKGIVWNLTVKSLSSITISGAGAVNAQGLTAQAMDLVISGAGTLTIAGSATSQTVTVSGAGNYNGRGFSTTNTTVTISGTGNATVSASGTLTATVSGAGTVTYYGSPQVTQHVSGVGTIKQGQ